MCQPHQLWRLRRCGDRASSNELPHAVYMSEGRAEHSGARLFVPVVPGRDPFGLRESVCRYHAHAVEPHQCCSLVVQRVNAPLHVVWSVVRQFDKPQAYKHFIRSCSMQGDGHPGSTRVVRVVSGLPASSSTERLEVLDEERHVISFRVLGGEHRLRNYRSVTTLHECPASPPQSPDATDADAPGSVPGSVTIVTESYVVDIPDGNTVDETKVFVDTIVRCNLQSLAHTCQRRARSDAGRTATTSL